MDQPSMAAALAADPNAVTDLLAKHTPDASGRCRVCRYRDQAPMWPCRLHDYAEAAQAIIAARSNGGAR